MSPQHPPRPVYVSQTANSMLWAIFNLSRNPGAQRRLLEEIRAVVPPDQDPCGEHIKSMPYLKACLKESMRYGRDGGGVWGEGRCGTLPVLSAELPYHAHAASSRRCARAPGTTRGLIFSLMIPCRCRTCEINT